MRSDLAELQIRQTALFGSFEAYRSDFGGTQREVNYSKQYETERKCRCCELGEQGEIVTDRP